MKKGFRVLLVSLATVTMLTACNSAPQEEISAARSAIDAAVAAGAAQYAPKELERVNRIMGEADAELNLQETYTFRNYGLAKFTLGQVKDDATALLAKITQRKEEAKVAATSALQEAETAVGEARTALATAPTDPARMNELASLEAELKAINQQYESTDFLVAIEKARAVAARATSLGNDARLMQPKPGKKRNS